MKTTEGLEPGNWLHDLTDNNYCIVKSITPTLLVERFQDRNYPAELSRLIPIPLTTYRLSLAKFQNVDNYYEILINNVHCVVVPGSYDIHAWYVGGVMIKEIRYVHELQNCYKEATGETLQINLIGSR